MNTLVFDQIVAQPLSTTKAVVWGDRVATYEQLRAQATRVANLLRAQGVAQGDVVVLALDQPLDAMAAALGALALGAVFVSLDPRLAIARAQHIIDDSRPAALIGSVPSGVAFDRAVISLDQLAAAGDDPMPAATASTDDPAVLVYMSKQTGRLEGLLLSRAGIADAISFHNTTLKLDLSSTLCVADYLDESSLVMALSSFAQGGTVYFTPAEASDGRSVEQAIRDHRISAVVLPLAALPAYHAGAPGMFALVKHILTFGNDLIDCNDLKQTLKGANVSWHNYYGFPEFQFISTIKHEADRRVHEGKPTPQVQAFILDQSRQLVAVGLPGELYVSGSGVFAGFRSNAELQNEHFCDNPFAPGRRLYRTGCTAKWLPNRRIEIVGRNDQELSWNGRRVALAEIEAALAAHPMVSACSVVPRTTAGGSYTTAFVVSADEWLQLDSYLAQQFGNLPPVGFVQLDRLPRAADGQIDRQHLAQMPILDSVELQQAEQQLRAALKSDELALVIRRQTPDSSAIEQPATPEHESEPAVGASLHDDPDAPLTLVDALVNTAERYPAHGVRYVAQDGNTRAQMYPFLLFEAQQILAGLRAHGVRPGDHLLFQLDCNEDLIPAFWACVLGGFVAVPFSPAYDPTNAAELRNGWNRLNKPVLLSRSGLEQSIVSAFAGETERPQLLTIEELRAFDADVNHHTVAPEDPVLLLLQSGSEGVVLTHRNSVSQAQASAQSNRLGSADVSLNWMPLDQVDGMLMFHIRDVCIGCSQVQAQAERISQDPVEWLSLIEQHRATVTWAPGFAFGSINDQHEQVNAVHRDLSSLRVILSVGEAVNAQTEQTFLRLLKPHRLPANAIQPASVVLPETASHGSYAPETVDLPLLNAAEQQRVLYDWNATAQPYAQDRCFHQLFEEQAARIPDATAIVFEDESLTYAALNARANQLAHYLQAHGVGPETCVGVCLERSLTLIVAILGVLKAGGAYVPLDPAYPTERLALMIGDSAAPVLLVQRSLRDRLPAYNGLALCIDAEQTGTGTPWVQQPTINPTRPAAADQLAYVIYTSGSTGRPKGVLVSHGGLTNLAQAQIRAFDVRSDSRVLQFASLSFDASISEIMMALLAGATLCLVPQNVLMPGQALLDLLQSEAISTATLPPSVLAALPFEQLPALRSLIVAGEACPADVAMRWSANRRFFNAYGPTETTVCATIGEYRRDDQRLSIGRPMSNTQVYLLNGEMQPVAIGAPGEIYIGSVGMARGYLHRPDLTAERFIPNPFSDAPGARLYRTGDQGRYLPDGTIEYLGRIDQQVKVRGYRIELGEIEARLREHPSVSDAVVVVREDRPGDKRLVGYVVENKEQRTREQRNKEQPEWDTQALRSFLQERLPEYMVPSPIVLLDTFPLTPNGKLDRHALPAPDAVRAHLAHNGVEASSERQAALKLYIGSSAGMPAYKQIEAALESFSDRLPLEIYQVEGWPRAADGGVDVVQLERIGQRMQLKASVTDVPTNEIEQRLLRLWQEVLGSTNIGIYDNFFAIGGHSLLATQLISRVRESFNVEIIMQQLFAAPTISGLSQMIMQGQMAQIDEAAMSELFAEVDGLTPEELDQLLGV